MQAVKDTEYFKVVADTHDFVGLEFKMTASFQEVPLPKMGLKEATLFNQYLLEKYGIVSQVQHPVSRERAIFRKVQDVRTLA